VDGEWLRIGIGGVVPIQWDVSKADDGDPGSLEGYASVWNVVDQQDDVVLRGAFRKTLQEWRASKRVIPLVLDHEHSSAGVIGSLKSGAEDTFGFKFTAAFSATPVAQEARQKAREGHLAGLSIFSPIFKKSFETRDGREIRILHELGLTEVSLTPFPANDRAMVSAAKTGALPEAWVTDMRAALSIGSPLVRKNAVDQLVVMQYRPGNAPAGTTEPNNDGGGSPASAPDPDDASKYALAIIGQSGPGSSPPGGEPTDSLAELLAHTEATTVSSQLDALAAELGKE
jgi:HK97 family phage prohead protease